MIRTGKGVKGFQVGGYENPALNGVDPKYGKGDLDKLSKMFNNTSDNSSKLETITLTLPKAATFENLSINDLNRLISREVFGDFKDLVVHSFDERSKTWELYNKKTTQIFDAAVMDVAKNIIGIQKRAKIKTEDIEDSSQLLNKIIETYVIASSRTAEKLKNTKNKVDIKDVKGFQVGGPADTGLIIQHGLDNPYKAVNAKISKDMLKQSNI